MKHKIIITNIPAFYKIRLFNEVNKKVRLTVVYMESNESSRNKDFIKGEMDFENHFIIGNFITKLFRIIKILSSSDYDELIFGYWDSILVIFLSFFSPKKKNAVIIESSYYESKTAGVKALIKKLFLNRINKVYASGKSQRRITDRLGFKGTTVITKGVGVFNYIQQPPYVPRVEVRKFFYVGRFVEVKNLKFLVSVFNKQPQYALYLAGFGKQELELKSMANENIIFLGAIENEKLINIYQQMDVFVLPSKSEAWGLVVEEALNNGLPVLVSDRVGCAEEIIDSSNGLVFHYNSEDELIYSINKISNIDFYNTLRKNISGMNFEKIERDQINCYIS